MFGSGNVFQFKLVCWWSFRIYVTVFCCCNPPPPQQLKIQCSYIGLLVHFWGFPLFLGASTHPFFWLFFKCGGGGLHSPLFISVKIMCTIGVIYDTMSLDNSYIIYTTWIKFFPLCTHVWICWSFDWCVFVVPVGLGGILDVNPEWFILILAACMYSSFLSFWFHLLNLPMQG